METRAHHVLIGLFTLIIFTAVLLFSLWLTKIGSDREFQMYDIVFNEGVSGLSQGSLVNYSGIRVGEVTELSFDPEVPGRVWARIRVAASAPIRQDTRARLAVAGITGTSNIDLSGGSESSPLLQPHQGEIPVIVATPSALSQLLSNGGDVASNMSEVLLRLNQVLSPSNESHLKSILENLDKITEAIAGQREDIRTILQEWALMTQEGKEVLTQTNKLVRNANVLLDGQGKELLNHATNTVVLLEKTSTIFYQLIRENKNSLNNGIQGFNELGPTLDELRRTLVTLRGAVNRLEENPSALLRGRERNKEFTP